MARYYFDIDDGERTTRDSVGSEFSDHQMARKAAIETLPEIASDELPDGEERIFSVHIRDERDRFIFKASLLFKSEWLI